MSSLPRELCERTLASLDLTSVYEQDLTSPMAPDPVGRLRVLRGEGVQKAVYVGLTVPAIGMDSHMVFAFSPADSAVPHFTLDSVEANGYLAFHLDLVPRADLAAHLPYLDAAFQPLTPAFDEAAALFGASRAAIGPRQYAMMSPWMLVHRATEEQFRKVGGLVDAYLAQWRTLREQGLPAEALEDLAGVDLAARDARNRANLFSPAVDPVWANVARLIGEEQTGAIRAELIAPEVRGG